MLKDNVRNFRGNAPLVRQTSIRGEWRKWQIVYRDNTALAVLLLHSYSGKLCSTRKCKKSKQLLQCTYYLVCKSYKKTLQELDYWLRYLPRRKKLSEMHCPTYVLTYRWNDSTFGNCFWTYYISVIQLDYYNSTLKGVREMSQYFTVVQWILYGVM